MVELARGEHGCGFPFWELTGVRNSHLIALQFIFWIKLSTHSSKPAHSLPFLRVTRSSLHSIYCRSFPTSGCWLSNQVRTLL